MILLFSFEKSVLPLYFEKFEAKLIIFMLLLYISDGHQNSQET